MKVEVYRKKTHTNQYLSFSSHHPVHHKLEVVCTLLDLSDNQVTEKEDRKLDVETVKQALRTCDYPEWALNKMLDNIRRKEELKEEKKGVERNRGMVVVPYIQSLTEKVSKVFKKKRVSVAVRLHLTLRNILVYTKDKLEPREGVCSIDCKNLSKSTLGRTRGS